MYATPADVKVWLSEPYPADEKIQALLDIAWARLTARVSDVTARVDAGTLDSLLVRAALVDIVVRVLRNPDPATESTQVSAGGFSIGSRRIVGADRIRVLDTDLIGLLPTSATGMPGTVRTPLGW